MIHTRKSRPPVKNPFTRRILNREEKQSRPSFTGLRKDLTSPPGLELTSVQMPLTIGPAALPIATTSTAPPTSKAPRPPTPPRNITIQPVTATTLSAYRRLITALLPIRYQDKYYAESIANPTSSSLALCAVWHDPNNPSHPISPTHSGTNTTLNLTLPPGEVVAGIQCCLEPLPPSVTKPPSRSNPTLRHPPVSPPLNARSDETRQQLYISTLCTLAPHRSRGIATALLDQIVHTLLTHADYTHLVVERLYAHVWEANEEALGWYAMRGFEVGERVEGYYRKLRPSGGRVVRRAIGVMDRVRVNGAAFENEGGGDGQGVGGDVVALGLGMEEGQPDEEEGLKRRRARDTFGGVG